MKTRLLFHFLAAALLAAGLTSCQTEKEQPEPTEALISNQRPLNFHKPNTKAGGGGSGKWTEVPRDGGAEYAQVLGDMEDVVSFYGFWSETDPNIKTFEDMEALMAADTSFGFQHLRRGQILGVPVLWFLKTATETGAGSERLSKYLAAKPRRTDTAYTVQTRGVFMLQPGPSPKFVTVACSRTSVHGQIGSFYESQFQAWLTTIVERCFL